jgi:hypothetical protein
MKNLYLLLLISFLSINIQAQNWAPVRIGETYHYTKGSTSSLQLKNIFPLLPQNNLIIDSISSIKNIPNQDFQETFTIGVDSMSISTNGVQEFHYSEQLVACDTCIHNIAVHPFHPSDSIYFFPKVQLLPNGNYLLQLENDIFELNNHVPSTNINATPSRLASKFNQQYYDPSIQDSIVVIDILDQNNCIHYEISISKTHGIVAIDNFLSGDYSLLLGKEGTTNVGLTRLTFNEIYNFDVGDIFYYDMHEFDGTGSGWFCMHIYYYQRQRVLQKQVISVDSIQYTFETIDYISPHQCPLPWISNVLDTITVLYTNRERSIYELRQGELNERNLYTRELLAGKDFLQHQLKYVGYDLRTTAVHQQNPWAQDNYASIFYPLPNITSKYYGSTSRLHDVSFLFSKNLGAIFEGRWALESTYNKALIGYIKGQDTVGIRYEPAFILPTTNSPKISERYIKLLSNPARQIIQLKTTATLPSGVYSIKLYDTLGNIVSMNSYDLAPTQALQLEVNSLTAGIYILSLQHQNQIVEKIKVIIAP